MRKPESQGDTERKLRILDVNLSPIFSGLEFCFSPKVPAYRNQKASQPQILVFTLWKRHQTLESY